MSTTWRAGQRARPPLHRPVQGRVLAGVCLGLARHLGLHATAVRVAFALLAAAGGLGLVAYAFVWALTVEEPDGQAATGRSEGSPRRTRDRIPELRGLPRTAVRLLLAGVGLVLLGVVLALQLGGIDLRLGMVVPLLVVGAGAVFAWSQLDETTRHRWVPVEGQERQQTLTRVGAGVAIAVVGLLTMTTQGRGLAELWNVGVAALVVLAGVSVIVAPYALRLWRDLRAEQAERIRATERADIAAHLHDSVLQTLALIQRRSEDPAQVTRLARAQERELRSWLYAGPRGPGSTLASAVADLAHEVEDLHGVPIELIVTGDHDLDGPLQALVRALREALVNAARHGAPPISAYVEVSRGAGGRPGEDGQVEDVRGEVQVFVRDHGAGFALDTVPPDRLGVRESILGRMRRHGGTAQVRALDDGTEVSLFLPLGTPPPAATPSAAPPTGRHDSSDGAPPTYAPTGRVGRSRP